MNGKDYDFRNDTGTYQTGRTQPRKGHSGLIAFLIALVILLSGISTALSILNFKLYSQLQTPEPAPQVAFSRSDDVPLPTEVVHEEVRELQAHLGISGTMIPAVYQRYYKLPHGVYISRVADRSEAQEKGLMAGDIITALDGQALREDMALELWASSLTEGDSVELTLYRSGAQVTITLTWSNFD